MTGIAFALAVLALLLAFLSLRTASRTRRSFESLQVAFRQVHTQLLDAGVVTRSGGLRNLPQGGEEGTDPDRAGAPS
jgi:hypothetical protein